MNATSSFKAAKRAESASSVIFIIVTVISVIGLLWPGSPLAPIYESVLVAATVGAVVTTIAVFICQTQGNRLLRRSQLTDSLGVALGDSAPAGYYNSAAVPSLQRLIITTFENTVHTSAVLRHMAIAKRIFCSAYLLVFILLIAYRGSSMGVIILVAQSIFSADVVLSWLRLEWLFFRTKQVREQLHQFFLQGGNISTRDGQAIGLAAFTDYECGKDGAAIPLDGKIFATTNAVVSQEWTELKSKLRIQ